MKMITSAVFLCLTISSCSAMPEGNKPIDEPSGQVRPPISETQKEAPEPVNKAPINKAPEAKDFIGLTLVKAQALAKEHKIPCRVVMVDGKARRVTKDMRPDRLNFTVVKGKVTKVKKG